MGLETGEFIADLVQDNPITATDPVSEGSDHIRLLKKTIQQSLGFMPGLLQFPDNNKFFSMANAANDSFIDMIKINTDDAIEFGAVPIVMNSSLTMSTGPFVVEGHITAGGAEAARQVASQRLGASAALAMLTTAAGFATLSLQTGAGPTVTMIATEAGALEIPSGGLTLTAGPLTLTAGSLTLTSGSLIATDTGITGLVINPGLTNKLGISFFNTTYGIAMDAGALVLHSPAAQGIKFKDSAFDGTLWATIAEAGLTVSVGALTVTSGLLTSLINGPAEGYTTAAVIGRAETNMGRLEISGGHSTPSLGLRGVRINAWSNELTYAQTLFLNSNGAAVHCGGDIVAFA